MSLCRGVRSSRTGRARAAVRAVVGVVLVGGALAACGSPAGPPVVALGPSGAGDPSAGGPTARVADLDVGADAGTDGPVGGGEGAAGGARAVGGVGPDRDVCDLVRDPEVMADVDGWVAYHPALEAALPGGADLAADLAGLTAETTMTPAVTAAMDAMWDALKDHCDVDLRAARCHDVVVAGLADPVGWAVRGDGPEQVEGAFTLARENWADLRGRVDGDELLAAVDAHLRFLDGAATALEAVGWEPGRLDALEPLEAELLALGDVAVVEPLAELEASCGLR